MREFVCLALMVLGFIGSLVFAAGLGGWKASALVVSVLVLVVGYLAGDS